MKRKAKTKLLDRISQILNNKNNFEKYEIELFDELLSKEEFQTLFQHQIKRMEQQIGQMERGKSSIVAIQFVLHLVSQLEIRHPIYEFEVLALYVPLLDGNKS